MTLDGWPGDDLVTGVALLGSVGGLRVTQVLNEKGGQSDRTYEQRRS